MQREKKRKELDGVDVNQSATEPLLVASYNVTVTIALSSEDIFDGAAGHR